MKTVGFSETIEACDLKVGRCRQLIELMKVWKVKVIYWKILFSRTGRLISMKARPRYQVSVYRTNGPLVSSTEPKAHRWAYSIPVLCCPWAATISNVFFSKTACPIKAKFYVEPPWVGGIKVCSRHQGHITKMAATPIYGKNPSKIFFGTSGPISTKLSM